MKVRIESSKVIKPLYESITPPPTTNHTPLSVFDKITYDAHIPILFFYRPPNPPNDILEKGLLRALSVYREFAGRLSKDEDGEPIILLNDAGVKFVEAWVNVKLDHVMPVTTMEQSISLHPSLEGIEELVQVQITRFTCGSIVVGFSYQHLVADGQSVNNFLMAWCQACRGIEIHPLPLRDRVSLFKPRDPPCIEYEHRGFEFMMINSQEVLKNPSVSMHQRFQGVEEERFHFSLSFLAKLKAKASSHHSTFENLVAHLWKAISRARGLLAHQETKLHISVNGRMRLKPKVPNEYFGNLYLNAYPTAKAKDLLHEPLPHVAKLIHDAVAKVNDHYFRSFIDFANHKVKEENLVPTTQIQSVVEWPDLEVDSWVRLPIYDLDFGEGRLFDFMPSKIPLDGSIVLAPSSVGDGSIDAFISLFETHFATFKRICYQVDHLLCSL